MGGEALVEVRDLLAQVFLLQLQQRFRIALFDAGDEEGKEAFDEISESAEHAPSADGRYRKTRSGKLKKCAEGNEIRRCGVGTAGEARPGTGEWAVRTGGFLQPPPESLSSGCR